MSAAIEIFTFEGHTLQAYAFRGRPCWIAQDVGAALGYAPSGWRQALTNWADELIDGKDVETLRGASLREFKVVAGDSPDSGLSPTARLTVLYESGVDLVCIKTEKPLGRKLRRFMADEVMPRLRRGTLDDARAERELIALSLKLAPGNAKTIWERETIAELCRVCKQAPWDGKTRMPAWLRGPMGLIYKIVLGDAVYAALKARNPDPRDGSLNYQFLTEARHKLMQNDMSVVSLAVRESRTSEEFFNRLRFACKRGPLQLAW